MFERDAALVVLEDFVYSVSVIVRVTSVAEMVSVLVEELRLVYPEDRSGIVNQVAESDIGVSNGGAWSARNVPTYGGSPISFPKTSITGDVAPPTLVGNVMDIRGTRMSLLASVVAVIQRAGYWGGLRKSVDALGGPASLKDMITFMIDSQALSPVFHLGPGEPQGEAHWPIYPLSDVLHGHQEGSSVRKV